MAYEKTVWTKGEVVTAEKLNKMEDGISAASKKIGNTVMSTAVNQLNDNALTSENLASVGFVETRLQQLRTALDQSNNPIGTTSRQVLTGLTLTNERGFVGTYTSIPLATTEGTGLMQVGANLDVTDTGIVKVSDSINSTENNLVLNDNVTIGNKITNTTSYRNVTIKGLLMAKGSIDTPGISTNTIINSNPNSPLVIGTVTTNQDETISHSTLTVEANTTFDGSSTFYGTNTFNESSTFNNDVTMTGQLNAPNVAANNIVSTGNSLVLNENVTIRKNTVNNDDNTTSYGNVTVAGSLTTAGASIKGAFKVGTIETNNTISNFYGPVYITGQLTGTDLSVTKISATRIQINKVADSDISYTDYTTAINGTVGITGNLTAKSDIRFGTKDVNDNYSSAILDANTTINGKLICNNNVVIQADSQGISWAAEQQTGLNYNSLIKTEGTYYSLFAKYGESDYNTILEYDPNITGLALNGILNIGTAMQTTGNTDDTMVSTINIAATNEIRLKTITANTSIVLDSNTEINGNTKVNGALEIINDTNDSVLSIGRTNEAKVEFTHIDIANIANLVSLPSLPSTEGDYILHYDGSQYTWASQQTT